MTSSAYALAKRAALSALLCLALTACVTPGIAPAATGVSKS